MWCSWLSYITFGFQIYIQSVKVSSRVKKHHFSKFAIFRWLNRAHQELSCKNKFQEKMFFLCRLMECKSFFYANYFNWSLTSPVKLATRSAVLNEANHAIWQKSWFTSIVLTVFPWSLKVNASEEEKKACLFSRSARVELRY